MQLIQRRVGCAAQSSSQFQSVSRQERFLSGIGAAPVPARSGTQTCGPPHKQGFLKFFLPLQGVRHTSPPQKQNLLKLFLSPVISTGLEEPCAASQTQRPTLEPRGRSTKPCCCIYRPGHALVVLVVNL